MRHRLQADTLRNGGAEVVIVLCDLGFGVGGWFDVCCGELGILRLGSMELVDGSGQARLFSRVGDGGFNILFTRGYELCQLKCLMGKIEQNPQNWGLFSRAFYPIDGLIITLYNIYRTELRTQLRKHGLTLDVRV